MRFFFAFLFALSLIVPFQPPKVALAADCTFILGFKAIHDMIPDKVGNCLTNEYHNAMNGDGLQKTAGGLLVWRKADNWTAFTDGYRTWVNGPYGLQQRLNTERFSFENDGQTVTLTPPTPTPQPVYVVVNPLVTGSVVESRISGEFHGWESETVFVLTNGQIWQQASYSYHYHYAYQPEVLIYPSNGRWKMQVEGVDSTIYVTRLR